MAEQVKEVETELEHGYSIEDAKKYGILEAVILKHLKFWIAKNRANDCNYHDGYYWTYNSIKAFHELFPEASEGQIRRALTHLKDEGVIITGNFNKSTYDRTTWYAISSFEDEKFHLSKSKNGNSGNDEPIPDNKPNNIPNIKHMKEKSYISKDIYDKEKKANKVPPTLDEVKEYCKERNNSIDAEQFIDYYQARGWVLTNGKKMKDWRAAVRTWERNRKERTNADMGANGEGCDGFEHISRNAEDYGW